MDPTAIARLINNFVHMHPFIALGILAGVALIAYLKPKETFKFILLLLGVVAVGYILFHLGQATKSGLSGKGHMINH
jgi:uncharacterized membrane protein YfcA